MVVASTGFSKSLVAADAAAVVMEVVVAAAAAVVVVEMVVAAIAALGYMAAAATLDTGFFHIYGASLPY